MLFSIWGHQAKERKKGGERKKKKKKKSEKKTRHENKRKSRRRNTSLETMQVTTKTKAMQPLVNLLSMLHSILAGWPRGPPLVWRAASAEHDAKNWEVHWYPQTSAKTKSLIRMPTAEKAVKERGCTQMPVAKKERTGHKCLWQTKKDQTPNNGGKRKWLP